MKRVFTLGIGLVLLLACVGTVSANLVSNGGFEAPVVQGNLATLTGNGLTGWTIATGDIDLIHNLWQPHSGTQSIDLSGYGPGKISQTINTEIGRTYELKFWVAGNAYTQGPKVLGVSWDGAELSPLTTFDTTGYDNKNMGWRLVTISGLKATQTQTVIAFEQLSTGSDKRCGVALDDISVEKEDPPMPVPEFPSLALPMAMLVGFIGIVLYLRESRKD